MMANYSFGVAIVCVESDHIELFSGARLNRISRIYFNDIKSVEIQSVFKGYIITKLGFLRFVVPDDNFSPNYTNTELMDGAFSNVVPIIDEVFFKTAQSCVAELTEIIPSLYVRTLGD